MTDTQKFNERSSNPASFSVVAKFNFTGRNNDELHFRKNELINVTQTMDGGWWEGSLNGRLGWFPSDYVKPVCPVSDSEHDTVESLNPRLSSDRLLYRNEIISNFITKEKEHLKKLERICNEFIPSIESLNFSNEDELNTFASNISEILQIQRHLLSQFDRNSRDDLQEQRFGKLFLEISADLSPLLQIHCENHCFAIDLINRKRELIHQALSQNNIELDDLIIGLSLVYRHVEKYAIFFQEIERNTPESHPDAADLRHACAVYRWLYNNCEDVRHQKESQLEFLSSGTLFQNFGPDYRDIFGPFLHVGKVIIACDNSTVNGSTFNNRESQLNLTDRCIAVFLKSVLLLDVSTFDGKYAIKNNIQANHLAVTAIESDLYFELTEANRQLPRIRSPTANDFNSLLDAFSKCCLSVKREFSDFNDQRVESQNVSNNLSNSDPSAFNNSSSFAHNSSSHLSNTSNSFRLNHDLEMILPDDSAHPQHRQQQRQFSTSRIMSPVTVNNDMHIKNRGKMFSGWCLRPLPPQEAMSLEGQYSNIRMRKDASFDEYSEDDSLMLKIVEGYCLTSSSIHPSASNCCVNNGGAVGFSCCCCCTHKHNQYPGSSTNRCSAGSGGCCRAGGRGEIIRRASSYPNEDLRPQLIVADNEKILVEEMDGDEMVLKERSLVDTVYALRDELTTMKKEFSTMAKNLESEQKARRRLEEKLRQKLPNDGSVSASTTTIHTEQ